MMNNFVVLPILIPLLSGLFIAIFRKNVRAQKVLSILSLILTIIVSYHLLQKVKFEGIQILEIGGWAAPFGIVLVVDMLSALLLVTTGVVSLACILYAFKLIGEEREKFYVYPLIQFLLTIFVTPCCGREVRLGLKKL